MNASRRLARLEERIRALGTICQACRNQGPDLLLAWQVEKEGREPVKSCPDCGRRGKFRFDFRELAMKWEDIKALRQRHWDRADAEDLPNELMSPEDLALRLPQGGRGADTGDLGDGFGGRKEG